MSTLATLVVKLVGDVGEFQKSMEQASRKVEDIGAKMSALGTSLTAKVTAPLVAMGVVATKWASDLEESTNKVNVVFGESSQAVIDFSQSAATNLGMSQQAALEAAGTFGNLFTAMGLGQAPAAEMSESLLGLAADLASFNNLDPTEVLEKLRSGLVGEVEPLRALGVNLNEATVKAKAMEMGLAATEKELTPAMLTQARYALILEQTTNAQGDFARTSGGLANQMRIIKARMVDAGAAIGTILLPYAIKLATWVSDLIKRFQGLSPGMQKAIVIFGAVAAAIGPILLIVGKLIMIIGMIGSAVAAVSAPVLLIIAAIAGAVALLALAWKNNWLGIRDTLTAFWTETIQPVLAQVWEWLQVAIPQAIQTVSTWWQTVMLPAIQAVFGWIQVNVVPILAAIWTWLATNIPQAIQLLSNYWNTVLLPAITAVWNFLQVNIFPIFQALAELLGAVVGVAITALAGLWQNVLQPALAAVWNFIQTALWPLLASLADLIGAVLGVAVSALAGLWQNVLYPALNKVWGLINTYLMPIFQRMIEFLQATALPVLQALGSFVGDVLVKAFNALKSAVQFVANAIKALADRLKNLKLPAWLTPGSPTPFEIGLRGVADALDELRKMELPTVLTIGAQYAGAGNVTYNQTVYTNAQAPSVIGDFQRMRALGT